MDFISIPTAHLPDLDPNLMGQSAIVCKSVIRNYEHAKQVGVT